MRTRHSAADGATLLPVLEVECNYNAGARRGSTEWVQSEVSFKAQGKGYQTHMNAVLREYVKAHRK